MRWKTTHRTECYPEIKTKVKAQERFARLLLIAVIAILAVVSTIYASLASADAPRQIDLARGERVDGRVEVPVSQGQPDWNR